MTCQYKSDSKYKFAFSIDKYFPSLPYSTDSFPCTKIATGFTPINGRGYFQTVVNRNFSDSVIR